MKDFLKYVMATIVGMLLCSIVATVITVLSLAGMAASEGASAPIVDNSILHIKLQGTIEERMKDTPLSMFTNNEFEVLGLDKTLEALEKAKVNDKILGVYLEGGILAATPAMAEELRHALLDFKGSGKFVLAYGDSYSKSAYYIASVADRVMLNPIGSLDWSGMAAQPIFYKALLAKIGVKMQVYKVGTYKSAVEPFICTEMSDANREQVASYLGGIWQNMLKDVAASRGLKVESLNALADSMTLFADTQTAVNGGLVDTLCYISDVKAILKAKTGIKEDENIRFAEVPDVANAETLKKKVSDEVAVYYAYGDIVDDQASGLSQDAQICAKDVTKDLQALREDEDVKAVVIRVNSGGGSAYASEQIWHEITLLKEKKPVVISMGGMAASGGYYISCEGNLVYAEPTTLTGSIGIFGMIPDVSELMTQKLGLSFDVVKTNSLSDIGSISRPFNEAESRMVQNAINNGYELFTRRVADGRKMKQDDVKAIAEGRVWTGEQALKIGLVDKLGDLNDAIAAAAALAACEDYAIGTYPAEKPWYQSLLDEGKDTYLNTQTKSILGDYYTAFGWLQRIHSQNPIQARMPFELVIK